MGKYGTSHMVAPVFSSAANPLRMASWCEPEKAVNTSSPA